MNSAVPHPAVVTSQRAPGQSLSTNFAPDKRLRIRIDLNTIQMDSSPAPARKPGKQLSVKVNSTALSFTYFRTRWTNKATRRTYWAYTLTYHDGLKPRREKRSSFAKLEARARDIALAMVNGETARLQLTPADQASYLRATELLRPIGRPIELAISEYTQCVEILGGVSVVEAAKFFALNRPPTAAPKTCPDIFAELIPARRQDGASQNTLDDLESRLGLFVKRFTCPILSVTAQDLNDWLRKLPVKRRTRNNYREAIRELYRFAKEIKYLPKDWSVFDDVKRVKNESVTIEIFTPEEIVKLMAARRQLEARGRTDKTLIPYMAIAAWAHVRNEEMCAPGLPVLNWREINFETEEIRVLPEVARKIGYDRIIPMQPNLVAWLKQYAKPNGPICEHGNVTNVLLRTAADAGVKWKDNGLRKSSISYRLSLTKNIGLVADEAGNSPDRIRNNYKKTIPEREARRWYEIWPTNADVVQLPLNFAARAKR